MSTKRMAAAVRSAGLPENDKEYFPEWVASYCRSCHLSDDASLPIDPGQVITFLQGLRDSGRPAWQRLQAVRAIEFYRDNVLKQSAPDLSGIRGKLNELAERERSSAPGAGATPVVEEDLVGRIDPHEPEVLQRVRRQTRVGHYSLRTESAYVNWIRRFLTRHDKWTLADLDSLGENDVKEFLTDLAVEGNVAGP